MTDLKKAAQQALEALESGNDVDPIFAGETIAALRAALEQPDQGGKTGWPPGLLQDDCRGLSKWLASRPDARRRVREAVAALEQPEQCSCGDRLKDQCPGEWEPGCDLGNNPAFARRVALKQPEQCMAREADYTGFNDPWLHAFAALVAAAEREACAKVAKETVCDIHLGTGIKIYGTKAAAAIRARGNT